MAAGKVTTGFSLPYVAKYAASGTTVTYSSGQKLARGVNVSITPTTNNTENNFYADNALAESAPGGYFPEPRSLWKLTASNRRPSS